MDALSQIETPGDGPVIMTVTGDAGIGKTSMACTFPAPIVIRAEDGLQSIPVEARPKAFPVLEDVPTLWDQMAALLHGEHEFKTLVIDSVTALERMFVQHIIDTDQKNPKSLNQAMGGYGAGPKAVGGLHQQVRRTAGALRKDRGMHVVFIAHADTETVDLPDEDAYTRYNLRLGKKSIAPYTDDVDMVGFLKLRTMTKGDEGQKRKAISDGQRIMVAHTTAANVSKNRYGITDPIPVEFGVNPLSGIVAGL